MAHGLQRAAVMRRLHIVVAEDDYEMRHLVAARLREGGDHVIEASDGLDLVDIIRAWYYPGTRAHPIDVIVTDVRMPGLSGLDVADMVRGGPHKIPIVLTTAFGSALLENEAMKLGVAAVLSKPFDLDELRRVVDRVVAR